MEGLVARTQIDTVSLAAVARGSALPCYTFLGGGGIDVGFRADLLFLQRRAEAFAVRAGVFPLDKPCGTTLEAV